MRFDRTAEALLYAFSSLPNQDISKCLKPLNPIIPSSSNYNSATQSYNLAITFKPNYLIYPTNSAQISLAVDCAKRFGSKVTVRSGGHSYAAGGLSGNIVLSLDNFKSISCNSGKCSIDAGNRLGDVALSLYSQGFVLPHGTCPFVGMGGHASLGGYGYFSRLAGLTVDTVTSYDVVLANGTLIENLTREVDPDLFWALKGSASSFGVITSFSVTPFTLPPSVVNFILTFNNLDVAISVKIYLAFQSFASIAPNSLGFGLTIAGSTITINGMYIKGPGLSASLTDYQSAIQPLKQKLPAGFTTDEKILNWVDALTVWAGTSLATIGVPVQHDTFYAKSSTIPEKAPISEAALQNFFQYLQNTPAGFDWFIISDVYGGIESKINSISLQDSSFGHRSSLIVIQFYSSSPQFANPSSATIGYNFVDGMQSSLQNVMGSAWSGDNSMGSYINYIDARLSSNVADELYWGSQYSRLAMLKMKYDPQNIFSGPQTILGA